MCLAGVFPEDSRATKLILALSSALPRGAFVLLKNGLNLNRNYSSFKK